MKIYSKTRYFFFHESGRAGRKVLRKGELSAIPGRRTDTITLTHFFKGERMDKKKGVRVLEKKQIEELENLTPDKVKAKSFSVLFSSMERLFPEARKQELAIWSAVYSALESESDKILFAATA